MFDEISIVLIFHLRSLCDMIEVVSVVIRHKRYFSLKNIGNIANLLRGYQKEKKILQRTLQKLSSAPLEIFVWGKQM